MALVGLLCSPGCFSKRGRDRSEEYAQALDERKTKTDSLRNAMRHLKQMNPINQQQIAKDVRLELNAWLQNADREKVEYSPSDLLAALPKDLQQVVGNGNPVSLTFSYWDVDYLFGQRIANKLSQWIVDAPVRDSFMQPLLESYGENLDPAEKLKLTAAYKLFDWTIRNIALEEDASSVEQTFRDPRGPVTDEGIGYGTLPWETLLFSSGDFIERGRVFTSLAAQRGIDTAWISIGGGEDTPGNLWTIGVVIGDDLLLFEPKLGLPILDPDAVALTTLSHTLDNERIMRRLDLAGQFDYAIETADLTSLELLIDAPPTAGSARMKMLEKALLSDERMTLYRDLDALRARLQAVVPTARVSLWHTPLLAQVQAAAVRSRLDDPTAFAMEYMSKYGVWLIENPASTGRLKHLYGDFENTLDSQGALRLYMDSRIDDSSIDQLANNPTIQEELGVKRMPGEAMDRYQMRVRQSQYIFGRAKVDAAFLMAQLHFDRGNYNDAQLWLEKRVVEDTRAEKWFPAARYLQARCYQELGELQQAATALTYQPSPQEPGNRLRLRYLRRDSE